MGNMKKKRIEQNEIKRYFLIIAAFLSFMILSLLFFLSWLQQDVEVSSRKTVATNVERQSYHLKSVLDIQFNYLTGMASYMGEREDLFCQENKNSEYCKRTGFESDRHYEGRWTYLLQ